MMDSSESADTTKPIPEKGCIVFFLLVVAAALIFFAVDKLQEQPHFIEVRASVTIFSPQAIGIDRHSCDVSSWDIEITASGQLSEAVELGNGEALHGDDDDDDACLYAFTVEMPQSDSYTLMASGSGLPPKTIGRVADRLFTDEEGEYLLWHILWEP